MNRTEYFEYNGFGKQSLTTRTDGSTIQYGYDAVGDLLSITDENGNKTEWEYNILGLPVIKKYADGSTYKYTYNEFGQPVSRTDVMNIVTEFVYDSYGNISGINYPNDPDISFGYDSYGRVNSMSDASGVSEFTYDISGNIESVNGPFDDDSISYEYDNKNRRTAMILNGSKIESYTYDPIDRISSITVYRGDESYTFEFNYHKLTNSYSSVSLDGKVITENQYDGLGRLINKTNKSDSDSVISKLDYTLNNADLKTKISSTNETNSTKEFSYNLVNELTGAKKYTEENSIKTYDNNYKYSFGYDPAGNRLSSYFPDIPLSYQPNELNQYTSIFNPDGSASTPLYNANGCMTKYGSTLYEYNDENRLSSVSSLQSKVYFVYDGIGRRRIKQFYNQQDQLQYETQFIYDGFKLIQETELNSNLEILNSKFYYWNNDTLLAVYQDNQFYFPQTDGNKNITSYTDSEGNIVAEYEYSPFGQIVNSEGEMADDFSFRFSSEYYDNDLDLYAYIFRYYSPMLGRWLSRDPLGEEAGINLYCMVNNDSINKWDNLGLLYIYDTRYGYVKGNGKSPTPPSTPSAPVVNDEKPSSPNNSKDDCMSDSDCDKLKKIIDQLLADMRTYSGMQQTISDSINNLSGSWLSPTSLHQIGSNILDAVLYTRTIVSAGKVFRATCKNSAATYVSNSGLRATVFKNSNKFIRNKAFDAVEKSLRDEFVNSAAETLTKDLTNYLVSNHLNNNLANASWGTLFLDAINSGQGTLKQLYKLNDNIEELYNDDARLRGYLKKLYKEKCK